MLSLNTQPVEKSVHTEDGSLDIVSIFPTIQGEGPFAGTPAIFIRLAGCNLQCPLCDTDYTVGDMGRVRKTPDQILELVDAAGMFSKINLIVLTGGEPLRQNISPLVYQASGMGYHVQVETNGTLHPIKGWAFGLDKLSIVCSPKTPKLNPDLLPHIHAYKYILSVDAVDPNDGLPTSALGMSTPPARPHPGFKGDVFVQPLDVQDEIKNEANVQAAVHVCMKYGYRLSLQMHKILGME